MGIDRCYKDFKINCCESANCEIKESISNILNSEAEIANALATFFAILLRS